MSTPNDDTFRHPPHAIISDDMPPQQSYALSLVVLNMTLELQCTLTKAGLECEWGVSIDEDSTTTHDVLQQLLRRCRLVC